MNAFFKSLLYASLAATLWSCSSKPTFLQPYAKTREQILPDPSRAQRLNALRTVEMKMGEMDYYEYFSLHALNTMNVDQDITKEDSLLVKHLLDSTDLYYKYTDQFDVSRGIDSLLSSANFSQELTDIAYTTLFHCVSYKNNYRHRPTQLPDNSFAVIYYLGSPGHIFDFKEKTKKSPENYFIRSMYVNDGSFYSEFVEYKPIHQFSQHFLQDVPRLIKEERYEKALDLISESIFYYAVNDDAHLYESKIFLKLDSLEAARNAVESAKYSNPYNYDVYIQSAKIYDREGKIDEAWQEAKIADDLFTQLEKRK